MPLQLMTGSSTLTNQPCCLLICLILMRAVSQFCNYLKATLVELLRFYSLSVLRFLIICDLTCIYTFHGYHESHRKRGWFQLHFPDIKSLILRLRVNGSYRGHVMSHIGWGGERPS